MASLPRLCLPGIPQHIIQRGINRQACFASAGDLIAYAFWLEESAKKYGVPVHAWVFMTNHVHLLVTPQTSAGVSRLTQTLGRQYVRYFNGNYQRTGTLWAGRFKSCVVNAEQYLLTCLRYIELNPVRAGIVAAPAQYTWSSYGANGLGRAANLWTPHEVYQRLGSTVEVRTAAYRALFSAQLDKHDLDQIRAASNTGVALGNLRFKQQIEARTGRRARPEKRGPKGRPQ